MEALRKFETFLFFLFIFLLEADSSLFLREPKYTEGIVGETVFLNCTINRRGGYKVKWYSHDLHTYISSGYEFLENDLTEKIQSRYRIVEDPEQEHSYNIEIRGLTVDDGGMFTCAIFSSRDSFLESSKPGTLKVYEPPDEGFPQCSFSPYLSDSSTGSPEVGPGSWVTITCQTAGGTVPSRLDWENHFEILPGTLVESSTPRAYYEMRLSEMDNGAKFTCIETNPGLRTPRNCTVQPFYYPTSTKLRMDPEKPKLGERVRLFCDGEAMPNEGLNFTWHANDSLIDEQNEDFILSKENNTLTIEELSEKYNNTRITCKLLNIIGLEGNSSELLFIKEPLFRGDGLTSHGRSPPIGPILIFIFFIVLIILGVILFIHREKAIAVIRTLKEKNEKKAKEPSDTESTVSYERPLSSQSVVICATPRDAIKEHLDEKRKTLNLETVLERPNNLPILVPVNKERCRNSIARENGKPNISLPVGLVHHQAADEWVYDA